VEKVSWADAQIFLTRLNAQQSANIPAGWAYVLPTESQWEYACRAGTSTVYSWGDDINATHANYQDSGFGQHRDIGQYSANPWGFFDMHGNVWEWTADWFEPYTSVQATDPQGPSTGSFKVPRGGSAWSLDNRLRSASRGNPGSNPSGSDIGFRVAFKYTGHTVDLNSSVNLEMLWVEPGTFTMGSPTTEAGRQSDREDEHNVTLTKGFYLGKYEVTQAQYEAVMTGNTDSLSATPSQWPNNPNRPVEKVSWADAQIFLTRLNTQQSANIPSGWAYVLPTESQWEYACRAGTTTVFSWGDSASSTQANFDGTQPYGGAATGVKIGQTSNVGQYAANPLGFFDMHGNVWEWTADWYQAAYPSGNPVVNPTGPASGSTRVGRGGSWLNAGTALRSAERASGPPSARGFDLGFRVGFQQQ
jgi:formylglycine-generating enzyme required for sulfatase activity